MAEGRVKRHTMTLGGHKIDVIEDPNHPGPPMFFDPADFERIAIEHAAATIAGGLGGQLGRAAANLERELEVRRREEGKR